MLQIQHINKEYRTGDLVQTALDDLSFNLRDSEFVAILGPSGSGKTTLLNVIGGLDRYDSGNLIINGISTKEYTDRDWDSYRNHTIGFVFQSYNLIPHQTVLSNVELALTISGVSKEERIKRATEVLEQVGLKDHIHKKPNQLSGGQMQRVAIARALVNDPEILLADEPTGALDSETSVQVMELLKEVAKDRLVLLVTHNQELAEEYATRIIRLKDGKMISDSDPLQIDEEVVNEPEYQNMGKSSMSFFTGLSLSFNNMKTKIGRTLLTAFAGSIGIVGIALILSISTGVNQYIDDMQRETMTSYPITIEERTIDLSDIVATERSFLLEDRNHERDGLYSDGRALEFMSKTMMNTKENNLTDFKRYLDDSTSEIHEYIGGDGIVYSYNTKFDVFTYDPEGTFINTKGVAFHQEPGYERLQEVTSIDVLANFSEMLPGKDGALVSDTITDNYELLYGDWPKAYDEVVLVLDKNNELPVTTFYELGFLPAEEYKELQQRLNEGEEIEVETERWDYQEAAEKTFYLVPASNQYREEEDGLFSYIGDQLSEMEEQAKQGIPLKISGIIRPGDDLEAEFIHGKVGYTKALTDYIIDSTEQSAVVQAQKKTPEMNVLSGLTFTPKDDETKVKDAEIFLRNLPIEEKAQFMRGMISQLYMGNPAMVESSVSKDDVTLAAMLDQRLDEGMEEKVLLEVYDEHISTGTYEENLSAFGVVNEDAPMRINIYTDKFENKGAISDCIERYNKGADDEDQITYTDYVGLLLSSVTTIINVVTYVLMAFVAVSLVVSSIMIGIITTISVLERTKEIGILRAIGASKRNISQVFNAETFIVGLLSGLLGIGLTLILLYPINSLLHNVTKTPLVNAVLPVKGAIILVVVSVALTYIAGLIPSRKAAKMDPVTALRTE